MTDVDFSPFDPTYRTTSGDAQPARPGAQSIWTASTEGTGTKTLDWKVTDGHWSVVVMNADGSTGVDAEVSAGASLPFLDDLELGAWIAAADPARPRRRTDRRRRSGVARLALRERTPILTHRRPPRAADHRHPGRVRVGGDPAPGAGFLFWIDGKRDDDGYFTTDSVRIAANTYAVTTEDVAIDEDVLDVFGADQVRRVARALEHRHAGVRRRRAAGGTSPPISWSPRAAVLTDLEFAPFDPHLQRHGRRSSRPATRRRRPSGRPPPRGRARRRSSWDTERGDVGGRADERRRLARRRRRGRARARRPRSSASSPGS